MTPPRNAKTSACHHPGSPSSPSRRGRGRRRADRVAALGSFGAAQHQHAIQRRRHCGGRTGGLGHDQLEPAAARRDPGLGGMVDHVVVVGEKSRGRPVEPGESRGWDNQPQVVRLGGKARRERRRHRDISARRSEAFGRCRIGLGGDADRQGQCQFRLAGDADLGADEVVDRGVEPHRLAGVGRSRYGDRHQQIDAAGIAIVGDVPNLEPFRHRPFDRAGGKAGRQAPGDRGRQPGIAGVAPIDVPAGRDVEMRIQPQRTAGRGRGGLGDELGLDQIGDGGRRRFAGGSIKRKPQKADQRHPKTRQRNPLCNSRRDVIQAISLTDIGGNGAARAGPVAIS